MEDRSKLLNELKSIKYTHKCPECGVDTYCGMDAGKSINNCWCFIELNKTENIVYDVCLCKQCLRGNK